MSPRCPNRLSALLAASAFGLFGAGFAQAQDPTPVADEEAPAEVVAETPAEAPAPTADTVLATVNGRDITLGELIALRAALPADYQTLPDEVLFEGIVEQLIDQSLLEAAGLANGVDQRLDVQLRIENQRRSLIAQSQLTAEIALRLTDERIQALYEERYLGAEPVEEVRARHILVETEEAALGLKAEIDAGADFAEMAMAHSTGPSGPRGGDLGYFVHSQMVPEFADAAYALEVGAVSEPVQSPFGWHLILLEDRRDQQPPALEQVIGTIMAELENVISSEIVEELREGAEISRTTETIPQALIRADDLIER